LHGFFPLGSIMAAIRLIMLNLRFGRTARSLPQ
jgi:hypothetical protein